MRSPAQQQGGFAATGLGGQHKIGLRTPFQPVVQFLQLGLAPAEGDRSFLTSQVKIQYIFKGSAQTTQPRGRQRPYRVTLSSLAVVTSCWGALLSTGFGTLRHDVPVRDYP